MTDHHKPFTACVQGWNPNPDDPELWPNTVRVDLVEDWQANYTGGFTEGDKVFADHGAHRYLVEIDTHYKPDRPGPYPVRLTRVDALKTAEAVLAATADTFHPRFGRLRPDEAHELLDAALMVIHRLEQLRERALANLATATDTQNGEG